MQLQQQHKQLLLPSPKLLETTQILQMGNQELVEYIAKEIEQNPIIDLDYFEQSLSKYSRHAPSYFSASRNDRRELLSEKDELHDMWDKVSYEEAHETLQHHLLIQVQDLALNKEEYQVCRFLIGCVDKDGFLRETPENLKKEFGLDEKLAAYCLEILRNLDPCGICAFSLSDCLIKQLNACAGSSVAKQIVKSHLEDLSKGHYSYIAKSLCLRLDEVKKAEKQIKNLDPRPAREYITNDQIQYINPDIIVKEADGCFICEATRDYSVAIRISKFYIDLLHTTDDKKLLNTLARSSQMLSC